MKQPPKKTPPETQEQQPPSKTSSTPPEPPSADQPAPGPQDLLLQMFAPLLDFHKAAESANADDVRMHWDVRLVRGKSEFLCKVEGSSTLPGLVSANNLQHAPHTITTEVFEKIAKPLADLLQTRTNDKALATAPALMPPPAESHPSDSKDASLPDFSQDPTDPTVGFVGNFGQADPQDGEEEYSEEDHSLPPKKDGVRED